MKLINSERAYDVYEFRRLRYRRYGNGAWIYRGNQCTPSMHAELEREYLKLIESGPDGEDGSWAEGWAERSGSPQITDPMKFQDFMEYGGDAPTRPSEDDMMHVPNPSEDNWVRDKFLPEDLEVLKSVNRPQYRDIGLRVNRQGMIVVVPELAEQGKEEREDMVNQIVNLQHKVNELTIEVDLLIEGLAKVCTDVQDLESANRPSNGVDG